MRNREGIYYAVLAVIIALAVIPQLCRQLAEIPKWERLLVQWGLKEPVPQVTFSTTTVEPGQFFVLSIAPLEKHHQIKLEGGFLLEEPLLFPHGQGVRGFIPLSYRTAPGKHRFDVTVTSSNRVVTRVEQEISVSSREFAVQKMYVSEELLARRDEKLWAEDHLQTEHSRKTPIGEALWEGAFMMPIQGRITTYFGQIRMINDQDGGRHSGLDILAPIGEPILAGNDGVVVLAQILNVTGNTVVLDHGLNLFSSYSHLDRIDVKPGQRVKKGQRVGTAGNTGFSTDPHLHWALSVGVVFVDPDLFLAGDPLAE